MKYSQPGRFRRDDQRPSNSTGSNRVQNSRRDCSRSRPRADSTMEVLERVGRSTEPRRCTGRNEPPWLVALPVCPPRGRPAREELVARCNFSSIIYFVPTINLHINVNASIHWLLVIDYSSLVQETCNARPVMRCIVSRRVGARRTRIRAAGAFRSSGIRVGQSGQMSRLQLGDFRRVHHSPIGPQWGWSRMPSIRPGIPLRRWVDHVQNDGSKNLKVGPGQFFENIYSC